MGRDEMTLPFMAVGIKELSVAGSFRYKQGDFETALHLVASGRVDVKSLISKTYAFEQAQSALEDLQSGTSIKVLIEGPR
jgi:D-xylulose reductase